MNLCCDNNDKSWLDSPEFAFVHAPTVVRGGSLSIVTTVLSSLQHCFRISLLSEVSNTVVLIGRRRHASWLASFYGLSLTSAFFFLILSAWTVLRTFGHSYVRTHGSMAPGFLLDNQRWPGHAISFSFLLNNAPEMTGLLSEGIEWLVRLAWSGWYPVYKHQVLSEEMAKKGSSSGGVWRECDWANAKAPGKQTRFVPTSETVVVYVVLASRPTMSTSPVSC